ncbi:MAG TPA: hypothetical protein VGC79_17825, partial [Polyangiaceae bacterium]
MSIAKILGGLVVFGLVTGCAGKSSSSGPPATAGSAGAAGLSSEAGTGGLDEAMAGAAGESAGGAEAGGEGGTAGSGGNAGASGHPGGSGSGGSGGSGGNLASAGSGGRLGSSGSGGMGYPPIDIGPQQRSDKLDVLFVVDNSVSMSDKQNILKVSLPSFVTRLVNPLCVDAQGVPVAAQPSSGAAACISGSRELPPVRDMHLGVITSSLGSHGGTVCATPLTADDHLDDRAELLPAQRANLPSYNNTGYLAYDAEGLAGVANVNGLIQDLQTVVSAAGETGCGYEAPLEAMYRFLVDPEPPVAVQNVNNQSVLGDINQALLAQR